MLLQDVLSGAQEKAPEPPSKIPGLVRGPPRVAPAPGSLRRLLIFRRPPQRIRACLGKCVPAASSPAGFPPTHLHSPPRTPPRGRGSPAREDTPSLHGALSLAQASHAAGSLSQPLLELQRPVWQPPATRGHWSMQEGPPTHTLGVEDSA